MSSNAFAASEREYNEAEDQRETNRREIAEAGAFDAMPRGEQADHLERVMKRAGQSCCKWAPILRAQGGFIKLEPLFYVALVLCAYLFASNEDYKDQIAIAESRSCIARTVGERATSERRADGSIQCAVHAIANGAPRLKYAEVWAR